MWAKLDDGLLDHPKIEVAGVAFGGSYGRLIALGLYTTSIIYANKHLTDGFLSSATVQRLAGRKAAGIMVAAKLWDVVEGGYRIHDFHDHNPKAEDVRVTREEVRQAKSAAGKKGAANRWQKH
jgi:hypothetical protein